MNSIIKKNKVKVDEVVRNKEFIGIILSEELIKKLGVSKNPFLKISIENEILNEGEKIEESMVACIIHEEGWGFVALEDSNTRDTLL